MTDAPKDRGGRPRRFDDDEAGRAARAAERRRVAKAHLKEVRAATVAKTANLSPETAAKADSLKKRLRFRSFSALITNLIDEAYDEET